MNKIKQKLELMKNGEGYYDPTAYEAIKKADAELEGKRNSTKKKRPERSEYRGPNETMRFGSIERYIKWKLKVLDELCIKVTDEEKKHMESLKYEYEVDQYAHRLIMKGD